MEGTKVDSESYFGFQQAGQLIADYVSNWLPGFFLESQFSSGFGHWGVVYRCSDLGFEITSDRGGLEVLAILLNNEKMGLEKFDNKLNRGFESTEKDLTIILQAIREIFSSNNSM